MNIGERIELARKKAGLTQQELADKVGGITKQSISKYEIGKSVPSSGVLLRLANTLGVTLDFLVRPTLVKLDDVQFRKTTKVSAADLARIEADVTDVLERELTVERIVLGQDVRQYDGPSDVPVDSLDDAEAAAAALREQWGLGLEPIANLTNLLEDHGVRVVVVAPAKGFDGLKQWVHDRPVIALAATPMGDRQRFTMAHELGHLILKCSARDSEVENRRFEQNAANRFAGALLVPCETVLANLGEQRTGLSLEELYALKHLYGASMQCWTRRARDCAVISEKTYVDICKHARKHGWRDEEPGDQVEPEMPTVSARLLERAQAEDYISEARAAELAGKSLREFRASRLALA